MTLTDYTDFTDKNDNRLGIDLAEGEGRRAESLGRREDLT